MLRSVPRLSSHASLRSLVCLLVCALVACEPSSKGSHGTVRINEAMARNRSVVVADENGMPIIQDWVEVYNPGPGRVALGGYSLSDNPDRPLKFRFPNGTSLGPGEFLVVYIFGRTNCEPSCDVDLEACLTTLDGSFPSDEQIAACDAEYLTCIDSCTPLGLVADFGFGLTDTIFLFSGGGRMLVDQVGVTNPEPNISVGRFPDGTGGYGVLYAGPTPGTPNHPIDIGRLAIDPIIELSTTIPDCGENVEVQFGLELDEDQVDDVKVRLEYVEVEDCGASLPLGGFTSAGVRLVVAQAAALADEARFDINGKALSVSRTLVSFTGVLPGAACGTARRARIVALIDSVESTLGTACITWDDGQQLPKVVINEYVARNSILPFHYIRAADVLLPEPPLQRGTPDWVELYNYGADPSDEVDLANFQIVPLGDWNSFNSGQGVLRPWRFCDLSLVYEFKPSDDDGFILDPGCFLLVLADNDEDNPGSARRTYRTDDLLQIGDPSCQLSEGFNSPIFYSVDFNLSSRTREGLVLLDPNNRLVDLLDMNFVETPPEFFEPRALEDDRDRLRANVALGRLPVSQQIFTPGVQPAPLDPGEFLCIPTPGGDNTLLCDVGPQFNEIVTIYPRNPTANQAIEIGAQVNFDTDTPMADFVVELRLETDTETLVLTLDDGLTAEEAPDQENAAPASILYNVDAMVDGLSDGTFVTFELFAHDRALERIPDLDPSVETETTFADGPDSETSFEFLVGFTPSPDAPRISEVVPRNTNLVLPPFQDAAPRQFWDYVEIMNPSTEPLDLTGYYLANKGFPESSVLPLRRVREFRFPDGTVVDPGDVVTVYFGPPPDPAPEGYIENDQFGLTCPELLYLVAPEGADAGANSIIDVASWDFERISSEGDPDQASCIANVAWGRLCDGDSPFRELTPTPGQLNFEGLLPPLMGSAYHADFFGENLNVCADSPAVVLNAVVFWDEELISVVDPVNNTSSTIFRSAKFLVEFGDGGEMEFDATVLDFDCGVDGPSSNCAVAPDGYAGVKVERAVSNTSETPFGEVVRYRVVIEDVCGQVLESDTHSFGTGVTSQPPIAINELNSLFPLPSDPLEFVPWVELVNLSGMETVDLSGLFLTVDPRSPQMAQFPEGTTLDPGEFLVIPLNSISEELRLNVPGTFQIIDVVERGSCAIDSVAFNFDAAPGTSVGRDPDGTGRVVVLPEPSPGASNSDEILFVRGDVTENGEVNVTDMVLLLDLLFSENDSFPTCEDAMDVDDNGSLNINDPIFIGNTLFDGSVDIPPPFPEPGVDMTSDDLLPCGALR